MFGSRSDGSGRAGDERHQGKARLVCGGGLAIDDGLFVVIAKRRGRDLATRIAVDTGIIDEKITGDVVWQATGDMSHKRFSSRLNDDPIEHTSSSR
jgi:hypothetical protein